MEHMQQDQPLQPPGSVQANRRQTVLNLILAALRQRTGAHTPQCPICGHVDWQIGQSFVMLSAQDNLVNMNLGGPGYPLVALICSTCGNTQLINLLRLGFSDLAALSIEGP